MSDERADESSDGCAGLVRIGHGSAVVCLAAGLAVPAQAAPVAFEGTLAFPAPIDAVAQKANVRIK